MVPADDSSGERGGSHAPVSADWPEGYGESTWWPIVVVAGVVGIYGGLGLLLVGARSATRISPVLGAVAFVGGVVVFVGGLLGWNYHGFVSSRRLPLGSSAGRRFRWGVALFIVAEVMTFGSGLAYYAFVRVGAWPPGPLPHLLSSLLVVNTVLLVSSSVVLHRAEGALRDGRRRRFVALLAATVFLGVCFLAGQAYEYYELIVTEGFTLTHGIYSSAFFGLTGLHGLHVGLGVVMLALVLVRAARGQFSADSHAAVTTASVYWHFVDAVWLVLVAVLYVGAVVPF